MKLTIEVNDRQAELLRQFYTRHNGCANDNMGTYKPLHIVQSTSQDGTYHDIAYFFTLAEARRYISYQNHNLRTPRIYTVGPGYSNSGDWEPFYDALQALGETAVYNYYGAGYVEQNGAQSALMYAT
jgi:hypothetical protein